jgi:hypothetical protein
MAWFRSFEGVWVVLCAEASRRPSVPAVYARRGGQAGGGTGCGASQVRGDEGGAGRGLEGTAPECLLAVLLQAQALLAAYAHACRLPDSPLGVHARRRARQERNAAVIKAEGESESAKLISDATKQFGMGLIELRKIEVSGRYGHVHVEGGHGFPTRVYRTAQGFGAARSSRQPHRRALMPLSTRARCVICTSFAKVKPVAHETRVRRALQAAKDMAETMSKSRNVVYLPNAGNMLMQINPNQ